MRMTSRPVRWRLGCGRYYWQRHRSSPAPSASYPRVYTLCRMLVGPESQHFSEYCRTNQLLTPLSVNTVGQAAVQALLDPAAQGVYDVEDIRRLAALAAPGA